jgi:hypothetical protein
LCRVEHVFIKDRWLGIGIGYDRTIVFFCRENHILRREIDMPYLLGSYLGYLPILAKFAVDVASGRGDGQGIAGRQEVEKRFFFDRIYMDGTSLSINEGVINAPDIFSDPAVSPLFVSQLAQARTQCAFDFSIRMFFIETGFDF